MFMSLLNRIKLVPFVFLSYKKQLWTKPQNYFVWFFFIVTRNSYGPSLRIILFDFFSSYKKQLWTKPQNYFVWFFFSSYKKQLWTKPQNYFVFFFLVTRNSYGPSLRIIIFFFFLVTRNSYGPSLRIIFFFFSSYKKQLWTKPQNYY